jgi:hypothetical protein
MIRILLRHVITELALNTLFNKLNDNLVKPRLETILNPSSIISEDIKYFERMRNTCHPDARSRYDNMINTLTDAHNMYYQRIAFSELGNEDGVVFCKGRGKTNENERRVWHVDIEKATHDNKDGLENYWM